MQATLCDRCGRNCGRDVYEFTVNGPKAKQEFELCAGCAFPMAEHVPPVNKVAFPTRDRAELVAKLAPTESPPIPG